MDHKTLGRLYICNYWTKKISNIHFVCILAILYLLSPIVVLAEQEVPLEIPKMEGSKSFDSEIGQLNNKGIHLYQQRNFKQAGDQFKKALNLAEQFRDPSQGIMHFNYALSMHHLGNPGDSVNWTGAGAEVAADAKRLVDSSDLIEIRLPELRIEGGGTLRSLGTGVTINAPGIGVGNSTSVLDAVDS